MGLFNKNRPKAPAEPPVSDTRERDEPYLGSEENLRKLEEARASKQQKDTERRPSAMTAFLEGLAIKGNVSQACEHARIARVTAYRWKANDEEFSVKWEAVMNAYIDKLEAEVDRRAFDGVDEPVIYKGEKMVDEKGNDLSVKKFSDGLARFRLGALRPDKYRERTETHHTGGTNNTTRVTFVMPDNGRD